MTIHTEYVTKLASNDKRMDGRKLDEFRKIEIEKNPLEKPEGSARVRIGETEVIVGVKLDVGEPYPDKQDEGVLITGAEFSPLASPEFETGPPSPDSIELARVVDRGIRESGTIDTKKLCIEKGEKVWMVYLDIQIINHSGNLIDAASLASVVALHNAKMPEYDGKGVNPDKKTKPLPVKPKPVAVTFAKIGDRLIVDPVLEEEGAMGTRFTVTTKDDGNVCAMQKSGTEPLGIDEIEKAISVSLERGKEIRKLM